uniref:Regulation of nuclear pre-mRNA domain-containing protein 2 n=1 Tax=Strigamia maritima TaxID=126957 RepID=T1JFR8_STRMM
MLLQSVASVRNRETRCLSVVREKVDACRNRVRNRAVQLPGSGNRANLSRPSEAQRRKMSKMASSLNEASLEKKLSAVTNTQESIQTLSLWCIHHRAHHKKIVDVWMKVLRKAKSSHRLALLYVANDVIQNSKRKSNSSFADSWANVLKDVMPLVRDEKIISQVERILTVWEERNVYESEFVDNIRNALTTAKTRASIDTKLLTEFKSQKVIDKIKRLLKVQSDSELKYGQLTSMKIDVSSTETLRQLKDRANGDKFSKEFEDATAKMGEYIQTLEKEVSDRASVVELLEKAEKFYDNQRGEAKIVANAYKNFASRVKNLKRKLSEMKNGLPSPVPSPTTDAPSPVDSDSDVAADASKDNTEAVDMEMSDEEVGGTLKLEDPDVASLGSAPSPDGSPVGLNIPSPPNNRDLTKTELRFLFEGTALKKEKSQYRINRQFDGFAGPNAMTSLIDSMSGAMSSRKGSLESRLSNFMQNMSNFSPAIDSSLFDDQHPATPPTRGSCHASRLISPCNDGGGTPLKDEGSIAGSTTPLQDEEFEATKASRSSNSWANVQRMDNKLSVSDVIKQIGFQTGAAKPAPPPPSWNSKVPLPPLYSNSPNSWQQQDQFSAPAPLVEDMSMEQTDPYMYVQPEPAKPLPEMYGSYGAANNYSRNPNIVELTPSPTHEAMAMGESGRIHSNLITCKTTTTTT